MTLDRDQTELWLQLGRFVVTASITIAIVGVFCWLTLMGRVNWDVFSQFVNIVVAFWFGAAVGARMMGTSTSATTKTTETDPSGAKREVTVTSPLVPATPVPIAPIPPASPVPPPPGGGTT